MVILGYTLIFKNETLTKNWVFWSWMNGWLIVELGRKIQNEFVMSCARNKVMFRNWGHVNMTQEET